VISHKQNPFLFALAKWRIGTLWALLETFTNHFVRHFSSKIFFTIPAITSAVIITKVTIAGAGRIASRKKESLEGQ
jgi:hypothetical protein